MDLGRNPPQNISAEQAALGSMLLQEDAIMHTVEILKPEDFYRKSHEIIYRSISELFDKSKGVDLVTLTEELKRKDLLERIGGVTYLTNLINSVPTAANIEYYVRIIEEKSILRNLINSATKIVSMGYEEKEDAKVLMDKAEHLMFDVSQRNLGQTFIPIKEILQDSFEKIEDLYHREEYITGVPSGFTEFDDITTGFQPSELIIIAGRPGMGKTAFCMNIAQNAAISKNTSVAIFSLEMSKSQLVQRMLCSEARVDAHKLRKGGLAESDWPTLSMAAGRLSSAPIFIDDSAGATSLEIKAKARRLKAQHNLGLIIIDYLQLMQNSSRAENRQQEISEISRSLKALARELNVPVIAASQLSRAVEQRNERRPLLSDLRESGAIEQDADLVVFIYREEYYKPKTEKKGIAEIIISKQRNGPTGKVDLTFIKEYAKFENLSRMPEE